jgi:ketosteroid isomerase-like protein
MKKDVVMDFVEAINTADVVRLSNLMTGDHLFIDSQDHRMTGKENLKEAWTGYFNLFPDYKIEINEIFEKESLICMTGYASGTYKNLKNKDNTNYWRVPAAWTAIIEENHVKQWQVYADNILVIDIINRNK